MKTLIVDTFTISFYVDTDHGSDLEFVLNDTGLRIKNDDDHYIHCLTSTIDRWLSRFKDASVIETSCYGSVHITVQFSHVSELNAIKCACAYAIDEWTKKYRINKMKKNA